MDIIRLKQAERRELNQWARGQSRDAAQARRARLILLLADRECYGLIREKLDCDTNFIVRWKSRFVSERLAGLYSRHAGRAPEQRSERQQLYLRQRIPGSHFPNFPARPAACTFLVRPTLLNGRPRESQGRSVWLPQFHYH
jgi:hypothetical protein